MYTIYKKEKYHNNNNHLAFSARNAHESLRNDKDRGRSSTVAAPTSIFGSASN